MAGVKGRSGRISHAKMMAKRNVLSWAIWAISEVTRDENLPLVERLRIIQPYLLKIMPDSLRIQIERPIDADDIKLLTDAARELRGEPAVEIGVIDERPAITATPDLSVIETTATPIEVST